MALYLQEMQCSRQEVLTTELPFIFAFLGMRQALTIPAEGARIPQVSSKYADGIKWEGGKSTKTISFGTLKKMAEKDLDGLNRRFKRYAQGLEDMSRQ